MRLSIAVGMCKQIAISELFSILFFIFFSFNFNVSRIYLPTDISGHAYPFCSILLSIFIILYYIPVTFFPFNYHYFPIHVLSLQTHLAKRISHGRRYDSMYCWMYIMSEYLILLLLQLTFRCLFLKAAVDCPVCSIIYRCVCVFLTFI